MNANTDINLTSFYPEALRVMKIEETEDRISIKMKSVTKECRCPECQSISKKYHGTYIRKVQDLPVLGKNTWLEITAHEYECTNEACKTKTIAETYDGFLERYSRMTDRCNAFVCTLALETSCEGCSRICRAMGIKVDGESIIRMLLRRFDSLSVPKCADTVGIDDFAFKKRDTYGTIIVDGNTHSPVAILDGRNGETLREWLRNNKHIKTITRDRASAYAKVISEELPDVMQIADRFHLYQNLLEAVKAAVNREIPLNVKISRENNEPYNNEQITAHGKKNHTEC